VSSIRARARLGADIGKEAGVSDLAAAAMAYVEEGRKVLPLNGKRPLYELAPNGVDSASDDPDVVRDWWRQRPRANVGLACGDGLMGLDVDGPEGSETLARLVAEHGPLPETRRVRSGRNDQSGHHHFAGSGRGWRPGDGLELRGEGSYVAAPPSVHPDSGRRYELLSTAPLAPLPDWLCKPEPPPRPSTPPELDELTLRRLRGAAEAALEGELAELAAHTTEPNTGRGTALFAAACALGRHVATGGLSRAHSEAALRNAGERLQLGEAEIERSIGHGLEEGETEPYVLREREGSDSSMRSSPTTQAQKPRQKVAPESSVVKNGLSSYPDNMRGDAEPSGRLRFIRASEVEPESVRWLWADRIPLSSSTLLVGREGVAKSMLIYRLVADATRGRLAGEFVGQPVPAIVATFEDAVASAAVPRLRAANADMNLVEFVTLRGDHSEPLQFPDDLEEIERRAAATGARLLTIDPLVATLPEKVNTHRDQHVRRALVPIQAMAEAQTLSALPVIHFNKAPGADPPLRVGGSIGFVASARSVLALGYDPDDPEGEEGNSRILAHPKSNYARKRKSVRCTVKPTSFEHRGNWIETACLELGEECDVGAAEFLAGRDPDARPKEDEAREWLVENLTREWQRSALVKDQAKKDGHATRTVQRAFSRMEEKGEAELREEGFPAHSAWRLAVAPSPQSRHGATVSWRDCTNPLPERDCGGSEPQSRHTTKSYGATGEETPLEASLPTPSERPEEDDEIAEFERLMEEKRREGR
jgi:Bifunctional DNA primase/polymerase, N-terminal/AAA domain